MSTLSPARGGGRRSPWFYRTLYDIWFRLGWRSSEVVALRFRNPDFARQVIRVEAGRMPRFGGIEAEPKTGPREVDCSYDPYLRPPRCGAEDEGKPQSRRLRLYGSRWATALAGMAA